MGGLNNGTNRLGVYWNDGTTSSNRAVDMCSGTREGTMTPWQELTCGGKGIHSIPEMHTTHRHVEGWNWQRNETLRQSWKYASGQTKPNYPVPAIRDPYGYKELSYWFHCAWLTSRWPDMLGRGALLYLMQECDIPFPYVHKTKAET